MEMDVNDLLRRQQMSLWQAQVTRSRQARQAYERLARRYTDRIDAYRTRNMERAVAGR